MVTYVNKKNQWILMTSEEIVWVADYSNSVLTDLYRYWEKISINDFKDCYIICQHKSTFIKYGEMPMIFEIL